jgi:hypothetical protein
VRHAIDDDDFTAAIDPADCTPITVTQSHDIGTPFERGRPGMGRERLGREICGPRQQRVAVSARHGRHLFRHCGRHDQLHGGMSL